MRRDLIDTEPGAQALTLLELNSRIQAALNHSFPDTYWVRAEMSDVRVNSASGHCYLEFVEKDARNGQFVARVRGTIWAKTFRLLRPYFELETGQRFTSGLKVLVKVLVDFHPLYGLNLTVVDIDPAYTLGDMARRRLEIIRQLKEEGVFSLNKELALPTLPQRVAVISSPTAAGLEDFMNQLAHNQAAYPFYVKLFPALMQGERTEESVIAALDRIYAHQELFDVVVLIRGGGATSDLNSFDTYLLAANCAQFPLPILTGIGHERDDTVVDMVAHTRLKTPTAVAEFLISRMDRAALALDGLRQTLMQSTTQRLSQEKQELQQLANRLPRLISQRLERNHEWLNRLGGRLPTLAQAFLNRKQAMVDQLALQLHNVTTQHLAEKRRFLELQEQFVRMASPDYILRRGYSLTLREGKIIKRAAALHPGETLTTRFTDGEVKSIIKEPAKDQVKKEYGKKRRDL